MSKIDLTIENHIATLVLDNPSKLNALTPDMLKSLDAYCDQLELDDAVHTVLLTGNHPKAFCVGADINEWAQISPKDFARSWVRGGHRIFDRLARLCKPTIAVLNGHAFGGGLELAGACDIRIMHPKARIALPEAGVGITPGWSATQRLQRLLPEPVIKEMALFGRQIEADRALQLGFVAEVNKDPIFVAKEIAAKVSTLSPRAVEITKNMIHAGAGEDTGALIEALGSGAIAPTDDKREGVTAFQDKRSPKFSGK